MLDRRIAIHAAFVLLLPLIVAAYGLSFLTTLLLVILGLLWRWAVVWLQMFGAGKGPDLVLETISVSHFAEKVRWCLDRLGAEYREQPWAGTLGAYYLGRSVPRLFIRTGMVWSRVGNSPEILRYLWGAYSGTHGEGASFLEPTPERLRFEQRLDRYGRNLQVWIYYHLLGERELCTHLWGANCPQTPWWQRGVIRALYPVQAFLIGKTFQISPAHYQKSSVHIETLLGEIEGWLADGRRSVLGGDEINYTDLAFASLSGVWMQPEDYGGGAADGVRVDRERFPGAMRDDMERWAEAYPLAAGFVERLYREERRPERPTAE
jgi:glutathione S-transferase